jgi:hypothetical protein
MYIVEDGNGGFYKDYDDWYDNGPGSENFKRSQRALNNLANRIVSKIKTGGSKMSDDGFETWRNSEKEKEYVVGGGYSDSDFLFNPETNKSTGEVGPRFEDPVEKECCKDTVKINSMPDIELGNIKLGKMNLHAPQSVEDAKYEAQEELDGHDAFGIRLCSVCGKMSDKAHRSECTSTKYDDDPGLYGVDRDKELEVHIRKISNGYVVSVNDEEQIFYAHDTVIVVLFKDLLSKLS